MEHYKRVAGIAKNNKKYYLDKTTGEVYTGIREVDGKQYLFSEDGVLQEEL